MNDQVAGRIWPSSPAAAGLVILLASPLYLFLFRSLRAPTRRLGLALWAGVGVAMLPVLLVMGTGELQFGHRYSSDLSVFLILLVALGLGGRFGPFAWVLLAASVAMNAAGALWFVTRYSQ